VTYLLQTDQPAHEAELITGAVWQTAPSAEIMLVMLWESRNFKQAKTLSNYEPNLRLFAASCGRRLSHLLTDQRSHHAIRTAELCAIAALGITSTQLHNAYLQSQAAVIEIAHNYNQPELPAVDQITIGKDHPTGLDPRVLFGAALLHAASTASMACCTTQLFGALQAAETCARYSNKALYYEMLTNGADSVLISEFLEEEDRRQAQALRLFLGNPFDRKQSPPMTLRPS
jgi:hypothetical protein